MKPDIDQSENTAALESQQETAGAANKLKVRRQTARLLKQAGVKPEASLRHESEGINQQEVGQLQAGGQDTQDAPRITVRFVFAESITEAQDQASFNAVQRALRKLLLDRGYDLAAIASTAPQSSTRTVVKPQRFGEVTQ